MTLKWKTQLLLIYSFIIHNSKTFHKRRTKENKTYNYIFKINTTKKTCNYIFKMNKIIIFVKLQFYDTYFKQPFIKNN